MSVKQSLMVLLHEQPMYGAQLKAEFERRTGGTWPLNVGQVYTTLNRLERDGLVEGTGGPDDEGRISYRLTKAGAAEVETWWCSPIERESTPRDELAIKLALAVTVPGLDVRRVVQVQRTSTLRHLQDLTRLKTRGEPPESSLGDAATELAWGLVLESLIFAAEAEVRWLDHVEAKVIRSIGQFPSGTVTPVQDSEPVRGAR